MSEQFPRGRFVWHELMTTDPQAAQDFYTNVIGWSTAPFEGAGAPDEYTMWMMGESPMGGVMTLPDEAAAAGAPPHWLAYVAVPDADATAEKAKDLGGRVLHGPVTIPDVGRFAVLADPQGAVVAAFTPAGESPEGGEAPGVGDFSWHELATTDHEAAFDFYAELFGWKKTEAMDMGEMGTYQMYGRTDQSLGGMFNKSAEMPGPPAWLLYTRVPDIEAAIAKVEAGGGQVLNGPTEVPGGDMIAQCLDPQGATFALHASQHEG